MTNFNAKSSYVISTWQNLHKKNFDQYQSTNCVFPKKFINNFIIEITICLNIVDILWRIKQKSIPCSFHPDFFVMNLNLPYPWKERKKATRTYYAHFFKLITQHTQ